MWKNFALDKTSGQRLLLNAATAVAATVAATDVAAVVATATEAAPEPEPLWSRTKNLRLANAKRTQQFPITSVAATQFSIYLYFTTAALGGV